MLSWPGGSFKASGGKIWPGLEKVVGTNQLPPRDTLRVGFGSLRIPASGFTMVEREAAVAEGSDDSEFSVLMQRFGCSDMVMTEEGG
jgi:hypothetical protein